MRERIRESEREKCTQCQSQRQTDKVKIKTMGPAFIKITSLGPKKLMKTNGKSIC